MFDHVTLRTNDLEGTRAFLEAVLDLRPDHRPERYLLAGENLTISELMGKISKATRAPMPKSIPLPAARLVSALQTTRYKFLRGPEPKVNSSAIAVMASGQFINGEKAARSLGFRPLVSVDGAIHRTLRWFQSRGMVPRN